MELILVGICLFFAIWWWCHILSGNNTYIYKNGESYTIGKNIYCAKSGKTWYCYVEATCFFQCETEEIALGKCVKELLK